MNELAITAWMSGQQSATKTEPDFQQTSI